jgi:phosphopantothenoylcysteine decarboxylase
MSDISRRPRIVIGFSGSVATIKALELLDRIVAFADVRVVLTDHAVKFLSSEEVDLMRTICPVFTDSDEWPQLWKRGDPVLHIELRKWADVFLIAPLSANTLAKLTHGLCDNLLTCLARAWDRPSKMLVAPAMNTTMYTHPLTYEQLQALRSRGVVIVEPVVKTLACGDTGTSIEIQLCVVIERMN